MKKTTPGISWLAGFWLLALLLGLRPAAQAQQTFAHPSAPFTNDDLAKLKANITRQPWLAGYQALQNDYHSQLGYSSPGATQTVSRVPNLNNSLWRNEMIAIHNLTFMYVFTGNAAYARKATDILDDWAVTNTTWGGGENLLDIGDMAPFFVPAADILRGTYPGWTAANTQHVQAYFRNVLLPSAGIDFTLRDNNKGALQLQTALGIAVFLDDAVLFQKAVEQYRIDAGAGLRCSLPNGEVGDTGRDAHWFVQIQALAWSAEVIYKQGIDVYADLNNRLLAIGELYNQYSIAPTTVGPFIPFGGYAAYWQNWGIGPGARPQSFFHNIIQGAYTLRKGIATPYTTQMQGLVGENGTTFLYRKSADATVATAPAPLVFPATAAATRLSRVEIGNTGIAGSASYDAATGQWTLQGAGNSLEGSLSFVGQPVHGDAAMVVKVESNANAAVEVGLILRSTLDASTNYMAVRLYGGGGVVPTSRGASFGTSYSHWPPRGPWWLKLERVGNRLFCYHSPDGVHWTNNSQTVFPAGALPADAYLGMYTMSNNLSQLNPAVLSGVAISSPAPAGAPVITSALAASGQLSTAFSYATTATNSPTSFSATGLPAGLSLNASTGVISGTPTAAGTAVVRLTATNASGTGAAILVLSTSSNVAPAAPVPTAGVVNTVSIRIGWPAVANATSYSVKRSLSATGPFTTLQTGITGTYFIDTAPTPEVLNYYVVTALAGALESGNSRVVSASVPPPIPPRPTVTNLPTQINLSWPASTGAVRYNVKRSLTMGGPYTTVGSPATNSYSDASVAVGTAYYYVVSARGNTLESTNSPEAFGMAGATARTWSPTPTDSLFNRAANWAENAVPQSPAVLTFGASTDTLLTNNMTNLAVSRLEFTGDAPGYTLGGNGITLQNDIVGRSTTMQSLSLPLTLSAPIKVNMTGPAAFTGLISGPGSLTKDGPGQLDIIGVNTYSGNTIVRGGGSGGIRMGGIGTGTPSAPTAGPLGTGRIILEGGSLTGGVGNPTVLYNDIEIPAGYTSYMYGGYANGGITLNGKLLGGGTFVTDMNNYDGINLNGDNTNFTGVFVSKLRSGNYRIRFNSPQAGSARAVWIIDASGVDCHSIAFSSGTIEFGEMGGRGYIRNNVGGSPTIRIGALNHNSAFGGTLDRVINIEKVGTGSFQMTGLQNSAGTTTVKAGKFMLDNDPVGGTFISPIIVEAGIFSGSGRSTAPVTVGTGSGTGATLDPGTADTRVNPTPVGTFLTTNTLTMKSDAIYNLDVNLSLGTSDKMTVGSVVLTNPVLTPNIYAAGTPAAGTSFTLIENTGGAAVAGTFNNLPELALVPLGGLNYRISYRGGTGNDVVLLDDRAQLPYINSANAALGTLAHAFSYAITAVNSPTSYGAIGLPAGLTINTTTGVISGTPTVTGTFAVTLSATNANGTGTLVLTLTVESNVVGGVLAAGGDARNTLDWDAVSVATSYNVQRATAAAGPYTQVGTSPTTRYIDNAVTNGTVYYYVVAAVDASGPQPNSAEAVASPNLGQVAYYQFNEASGTRGVDAWGGNHATLQATATRSAGYAGTALQLDGTATSYATLPVGIINGQSDFTISARVKMDVLSNNMRVFDFGNSTTEYMFLSVQAGTSAGKSLVRFGTRNGTAGEQGFSYAYAFPLNTWVSLAVAKAGATTKLYINGLQVASATITTPGLTGTLNNYLGKSQFNDPVLQGAIDEFRIYSRALTGPQTNTTTTPLPVVLTEFTAQPVASRDALLNWRTASETNSAYFDVERSLDGTTFTKIGQTPAHGTTTSASTYTLTDQGVASLAAGPVYYRLKQVDLDGKFSYSPVRSVSFGAAGATLSLYPNPARQATTLDLSPLPATATYQVQLLDATGRTLRQLTLPGGQRHPLDLAGLSTGTYQVLITGTEPGGAALRQSLRLVKE